MAKSFICDSCLGEFLPGHPYLASEFTTGYGNWPTESGGWSHHCFGCCGALEARDMQERGKAILYLTMDARGHTVGNWPGTLKLPCSVRKGRHNIAGTRYDVWFRHAGRAWHGVQYGENTQIVRCRRLAS